MAKKKATRRKQTHSAKASDLAALPTSRRLLLVESIEAIRDQDINNFALMVFTKDKEKWSEKRRRDSTEATMRFANLGWAFFHAFEKD